jgi:hypothetical protein
MDFPKWNDLSREDKAAIIDIADHYCDVFYDEDDLALDMYDKITEIVGKMYAEWHRQQRQKLAMRDLFDE